MPFTCNNNYQIDLQLDSGPLLQCTLDISNDILALNLKKYNFAGIECLHSNIILCNFFIKFCVIINMR